MTRSMSARNCARRVVFPYFSKPLSVCCFIEGPVCKLPMHQTLPVNQSFPRGVVWGNHEKLFARDPKRTDNLTSIVNCHRKWDDVSLILSSLSAFLRTF